jgi:hypothetical protein
MERQKRGGNHSPPKNKSVQDSEGNDPDSNKTKINYTKEPNEAHKIILKEEILEVINKNFIEMLLTWSTKKYRWHSRHSKTTKINNMRKHKNK